MNESSATPGDAAAPTPAPTPMQNPPAASSPLVGRLCVLAAAVMWSTSGLFAKTTIFDDWPDSKRGLLLAFWRAFFAGLLLLPFVRRPRWNKKLLPMALCFTAMNATYLSAVTLTTAANAIWLQSTAPLWVFAWSVFVLKRPAARRDLVPLCFCAAGIATILAFELSQGSTPSAPAPAAAPSQWPAIGILLGVLAGMGYAGVILLLHSLRGENPVFVVAVNHLAAACVIGPVVLWLGPWPTAKQFLVLAAFGLFQMGLPYLLFFRGLRSIAGQEASLIALLEPVLVPVWVWLILQNYETRWWTLVGGAMILAGLALRYTRRRPNGDPQRAE
jgi:drug/metabolite transporter (DMT)-like permease